MAAVDGAVGIGRSIVEDERLGSILWQPGLTLPLVQAIGAF